jgi:F-type H+-transporting ATPase subunit epsilon
VAALHVELVAVDRQVWSGEAQRIIARTVDGDIGILPRHAPVLGVLVNGVVRILQPSGDELTAAVHGGFLSVSEDEVAVLAEAAELAGEIDVERAQAALERARAAGPDDEDGAAATLRASVRLRASGRSG